MIKQILKSYKKNNLVQISLKKILNLLNLLTEKFLLKIFDLFHKIKALQLYVKLILRYNFLKKHTKDYIKQFYRMIILVVICGIFSLAKAKQNYINNDFKVEVGGEIGKLIYNLGQI